jgi:hypothetical protein
MAPSFAIMRYAWVDLKLQENSVFRKGWWIGMVVVAVAFAAPHKPARAQVTDYTAGKTPAQLFSSDCSACHQSPRGLAKSADQRSLTGFLREHYTSKVEAAGALAGFLIANPGSAAEPRGRHSATRGSQAGAPRPAVAVDGLNEAEQPAADDKARTNAARDRSKPADAKTRSGKRKKADPAEAAREAAAAAEEAEKAKVRAYATSGEEAIPRVVAAPAPDPSSMTTPAVASEPSPGASAPDAAASTTPTAPAPTEAVPTSGASQPGGTASSSERPAAAAPAAESPAGGGGERPAQAPPG